MPRSPEQNNRRPVALTPEVRPRRRRVYFARVLKVKVYDQAVNGWCPAMAIVSPFQLLARGCVCCFAPCFAFLVAAKESPGVVAPGELSPTGVKLLRESMFIVRNAALQTGPT